MKVGVAYSYQEVLAWAVVKYFQFSNNIMLLKLCTKVLNLNYVAMLSLVSV